METRERMSRHLFGQRRGYKSEGRQGDVFEASYALTSESAAGARLLV